MDIIKIISVVSDVTIIFACIIIALYYGGSLYITLTDPNSIYLMQ